MADRVARRRLGVDQIDQDHHGTALGRRGDFGVSGGGNRLGPGVKRIDFHPLTHRAATNGNLWPCSKMAGRRAVELQFKKRIVALGANEIGSFRTAAIEIVLDDNFQRAGD